MASVNQRTSVRVILIDIDDRVLLLGARNPDDGRATWFLPGGGIEGSESLEEAARRELLEELGLDPVPTGPVWHRDHQFTGDGRDILQHEWFFVAHLERPIPPEAIRIPDQEGGYSIGAKWLGVEDLKTWPDTVAPRPLPELLPPLIAGEFPPQPIDTGV